VAARFLCYALLGALAACGGGGSSAPEVVNVPPPAPAATVAPPAPLAPAPAPAPVCTPRVVTVALLGDSTQWGWDAAIGSRAPNYPSQALQAAMNDQFGVDSVQVLDYSVPASEASQAPVVKADVVVENFGINDMRFGGTLEQYQTNLYRIGATIVETQSPITLLQWQASEQQYVAGAKQVAAQTGAAVADVNTYVRALPNWEQYLAADGIHPNSALYGLIVSNVLVPSVANQVAPLRCQ
jgi:lysophospholipase L1-like esterase